MRNIFKTRFLAQALVCLLVVLSTWNVSVAGDSYFKEYDLNYGIKVKVPRHWVVIDKKLMQSIDSSTEAITGVGQYDNDIIIAANCYIKENKKAAATFRISVRNKKSINQQDVEKLTELDLSSYSIMYESSIVGALKSSGMSNFRVSNCSSSVDKISKNLALKIEYELIEPGRDTKNTLYIIFLGNKIIKVNFGYDLSVEKVVLPTINHIKNSIKIRPALEDTYPELTQKIRAAREAGYSDREIENYILSRTSSSQK